MKTETIRIRIELLTPLHVGTGASLINNLDYVQVNDSLAVIDVNKLLEISFTKGVDIFSLIGKEQLKEHWTEDFFAAIKYWCEAPQGVVPHAVWEQMKDLLHRPMIPAQIVRDELQMAMAWWLIFRSAPFSALAAKTRTIEEEKERATLLGWLTETLVSQSCGYLSGEFFPLRHSLTFSGENITILPVRWQQHDDIPSTKSSTSESPAVSQDYFELINARSAVEIAVAAEECWLPEKIDELIGETKMREAPTDGPDHLLHWQNLCYMANEYAVADLQETMRILEFQGLRESVRSCRQIAAALTNPNHECLLHLPVSAEKTRSTSSILLLENLSNRLQQWFSDCQIRPVHRLCNTVVTPQEDQSYCPTCKSLVSPQEVMAPVWQEAKQIKPLAVEPDGSSGPVGWLKLSLV